MNIAIFSTTMTLTCIISLTSLELLKRKTKISAEVTRRLAHIIIGIVAAISYAFGSLPIYAAIVSVMILSLIIIRKYQLLASIHQVTRKGYGEIYLGLGLLAILPITIGNPAAYITAVLITTFADSLSGIVSNLEHRTQNTALGALAFLLASTSIFVVFAHINWHLAISFSIILACVEMFSKKGSDNLTVPLAAALLLSLF
jgi:dolichol kinase